MNKGILLFVAVVLGLTSCNKKDDDNTTPSNPFPLDVAAQYVSLAFSNASGGLNYHLEKCAALSTQITPGSIIDTVFDLKNQGPSDPVKYSYSVSYNGTLFTGIPRHFNFEYFAQGNFVASGMSSVDQQNGKYTVSGLEQDSTNLAIAGYGSDGGNQQAAQMTFSSSMSFSLVNVKAEKNNYMMISGSATLVVTCQSAAEGLGSTYAGLLTFRGNRDATLKLDTLTYKINLLTGALTK